MSTSFDSALDEIEIFRDLDPAARAAIARRCRWRRVSPHEQVLGHLDNTTDVFFVVQGQLRANTYSPLGKDVSFEEFGPGEMFGEFSAIDGQSRSANVVALNDAYIGSMPAGEFWGVIDKHPAVAAAVLKRLTGIIRTLNERIFEFSALAVSNRIHAELLRLAHRSGVRDNAARLSPAPTHAEIASRISTNREGVTREINALARSGVVAKEGRDLVIRDVAWLEDAVALKTGISPPHGTA